LLKHFIDDNVLSAILDNDYHEFLNARAKLIYQKIMECTKSSTQDTERISDLIEDNQDDIAYLVEEAVNE